MRLFFLRLGLFSQALLWIFFPMAGQAQQTPSTQGICCLCEKAGAIPRRDFFRILDATNCANYIQSPTVLGSHSAGDFQGITCQNAVTCQNPQTPANMFAVLQSPAPAPAPQATTPSASSQEQPFKSITPTLSVPIPGLQFGPATKDSGQVQIPFLAQYLSALYRYAVGIVALVATIMVAYGGFRYLVGSTAGDISKGKTIIMDALVGMILVLGAYAILNTVNPDTVSLSFPSLSSISFVDIDSELSTVRGSTITASEGGDQPDQSATAQTGTAVLTVGSKGDVSYSGCPVQLTQPEDRHDDTVGHNPRSQEFRDKFMPLIADQTGRDCVDRVLAAAAKCNVHFGSCGNTAITANLFCNTQKNRRDGFSVPPSIISSFKSADIFNQTYPQFAQPPVVPTAEELAQLSEPPTTPIHPTKDQVRALIQSKYPDWPDAQMQSLQPGDQIYIYNANRFDTYGLHTIIFQGWVDDTRARIVQGQHGSFVNERVIPLKNAVIVKTFTFHE